MKLLLIEDDRDISQNLKKGFAQENILVDCVFDGEEGLDFALAEAYDVIILDLGLPKLNGFEVCKRIRKKNLNVKILVLSARSEVSDKVELLKLGADDYLSKPFSFEELLARVYALSRRPQSVIPTALVYLDLKLIPSENTFLIHEKKVDLSKKEFLLMEKFMQNPEKILSKDVLLQNLWEFDKDVLPNTLEKHLAELRKKIGKKYIKTVYGFGYILKM